MVLAPPHSDAANDAAMLRAFELGGDFHSRTAMSMYDYVAKAVEAGEGQLFI